ncbi:MAG: hypothetical protein QMD12_03630, partial [Candidatus Aenigmarchaeota archaeon]|nr:hypothetical protein [Candidatus Aenigmarchaeota archaeon]
INCSLPGWEACGTSDQRWAINGRGNIAHPTGGPKEYGKEFEPTSGKGNLFFLSPYEPLTLYRKLKMYSDLYYGWVEEGDPKLLQLHMNSFETGKRHDIVFMIEQYEKIFEKLLNR